MSDIPSYRACTCGAGCEFYGTTREPCWGECIALLRDDTGIWRHYCEGHKATFYGKEYAPMEKEKE